MATTITGTTIDVGPNKLVSDSSGNVTASGVLSDPSGNVRAGRKNLIINGGFDVWQRGTSFTNNNSVLFAADRYATFSNGASTTSQQAFTFGQTDVASNPKYYLRWDVSTYSSGDRIYQRIEDVITISGQSVTLSYWAKAETATTMVPQATQAFGSGGSTAVTTAIDSVALTTSWQKFTRTFTLPSVSGKTIGAGSFLEVGLLRFTTSYTGYVDIANVQLELGSVATDFEHRSHGEELALCQRYFYQHIKGAGMIGLSSLYSATFALGYINFPVTMRAAPTGSAVSGLDYYVCYAGGVGPNFNGIGGFSDITTNTVRLEITLNTNGTAGRCGVLQAGNANAGISFDAEL